MLRMRPQILIALSVLAVTLTACGQDRVGNAAPEVVRLRGETALGPDEVSPYLDKVASLSGDAIALDVFESTSKPIDIESQVVDRVASGSLDIGFVGTRTWPGLDVHAFDALLAPFLIDSYELQQAALEAGVVGGADDSLSSLGLVSLGILPGPLRVPAGREGPYVGPADYAGATIGMSNSAITEATLDALGATATALRAGTEDVGNVDGMEAQIGAIPFEGSEGMHFVTGNVVLWPRPISVVMNAERYAALTPDQQTWLREAVDSSLDEMTKRAQRLDRETVGNACRNGAQFVNASASDLAGLRAAVEPVYSTLRKDPATSRAIDAIEALRSSEGLSLSCGAIAGASAVPGASATGTVTTPVDGAWTVCITEADVTAAGGDPEEAQINAGCSTMSFEGGTFRESGPSAADDRPGTYSVEDDQLIIRRANGEKFEFTWSLYEDQLSLGRPADATAISPAPIRALPWIRQEG
jgi:TRAP-type C4-dicarboxylate transport system substrate-binding protein